MAKIIALFNHKGGVSKTTTTFHLGWMLAEKGHRVIIADTDPQCNLTGLVTDFTEGGSLEELYDEHPGQNIYNALLPAYESQPRAIEGIECIQIHDRPELYLLPGHVRLSEFEVTLGMAQEISASIQALKNLPGAFKYLFDKTAEMIDAEFILVDMGPSLGAINQNLLTISNYFIVPTAPDYFSHMAIDSLSHVLPRWLEWGRRAYGTGTFSSSAYPFPEPSLKFLGTIVQKYRPRKAKPSKGFQEWIDAISDIVNGQLVPILQRQGAVLSNSKYASQGLIDSNYCLAEIPDFNTLIATSQANSTPVFALTEEMIAHVGAVLDQNIEKRDEFKQLFSDLADKVIELTND